MHEYIALIPLIYLVAAIPFVVMGLYAWNRRPAVGVSAFAWMMGSMALWSFAYSLEIFSPLLNVKLFLVDIEYLGIVSIPVFLLVFAFEYTGKRHLLTPTKRAMLWLIPLLILASTWTNDLHGLMWHAPRIEESDGLQLLAVSLGPLFWLNIAYSYLLIFIGILILIMEFVQRPGVYRFQASLVILGLFSPWVGSIFYVFDLSPVRNLDLTPLFFLPSGLALGWAITRYRLLDVIPLEHISVLQNMRDGVIVLDAQQRIAYFNPIAEILLNASEAETIGQPLIRVAPMYAKSLAPHLKEMEERFEAAFSSEVDAPIYEVTVSPMSLLHPRDSGRGLHHVVNLHDISLHKETESLLTRREAIMEAISFAAEQFLKEPLWEHTIPAVLEKIGQAANVSRVYVAMNYTDEEGILYSSLCYEWAAPDIHKRINDLRMLHMPLRKLGLDRWEDHLTNGQSIQGSVKDFPEAEQKGLEAFQTVSLAMAPIFVEKQWWGFIGFDECRSERRWIATELEALQAAANIFGSAETRARTEQKLVRRQRTLNLLHNIVLTALKSTDLAAMAQTLVDRLGELIHADGCFLSLWDEVRRQAIPLAAYGPYKDTYAGLRPLPGEKTFTASALQRGRPLIVEDALDSPYVSPRIARMFKSRSVLALPLITGKTRLGVILLTFDRIYHFESEQIAISEQAADVIALALEKFQVVELARRRADEAERLRKAGSVVTETLHTGEAVQRILEQLAEVIPYDSASVQLLDGNELVIVGGRGWDDEKKVLGMRFPIPGDNPNTRVIETGKAVILSEAEKDYPAFNNPPHSHIRSWLGVPLMARGQTIGLLTIDSSRPNHFIPQNTELVTAFANQVAIALENARLFTETQTQAVTDSLTNLYNRRGLFEQGEFELSRARRLGRPFSAMMLDIDHFKQVNDRYGHAAGDHVLRTLAERCRRGSRAVDVVGRYGGEEFVLLLPEADLEAARVVAERLRLLINADEFVTEDGGMSISVSVGVAEIKSSDSLQSLINRADGALYEAKKNGRNCVAVAR